MGAGAAARTSPPRRASAWNGCCACGTTTPARSTTRWGSARATHKTLGDHDIWRLPQADDTYGGEDPRYRYIRHRPGVPSRPARLARQPQPGRPRRGGVRALLPGLPAAAQPALAERCLLAGEHIFELADTNPHGHLLTAIPFGFYPETRMARRPGARCDRAGDRAAPAAAPSGRAAAHATRSSTCDGPRSWASAYIATRRRASDPLNLYDVSGLAHFELVRALRQAGDPPGLAVTEAAAARQPRARSSTRAVAHRAGDPFGFGFPWDDRRHGLARRRAGGDGQPSTTTSPASRRYAPASARWLGNVLGANAWGVSLIIGDGSTFPDCPSASGREPRRLARRLAPGARRRGRRGPERRTPAAARSAGMRRCPADGGNAVRARSTARGRVPATTCSRYTTVEPAIDLTASSPLAFSWQVASPSALAGYVLGEASHVGVLSQQRLAIAARCRSPPRASDHRRARPRPPARRRSARATAAPRPRAAATARAPTSS